jgi:hypothetical protein
MNPDDHTMQPARAESTRSPLPAPGTLARRALARTISPYARFRARQAALDGAVGRLEADVEHLGERHTEQIERLEEIVRELILAVEGLRAKMSKESEQG